GWISLAEALGLLAIGADPVAPGAQRVRRRRPKHVGHARECAARGAIPQRRLARASGCSRQEVDAERTQPGGWPASVRCSRPATLTARAFRSILDVEHALTTPRIAKEMTAMAPLEARDSGLHALVAPDAPIERVAGGLWFTEGPVWRDGALLFSDIPNKRIARWRRLPEGPELTTYAKGTSNGLTLDRQGRVLAAEHDGRRVSRVADDGARAALAEQFQGKRLN